MIVAQRPLIVGGKNYLVGDEIPETLFLPHRIPELEEMGLIRIETNIRAEKEIIKSYNPEKLKGLKKKDLIKIAQDEGKEIDDTALDKMTNKELIDVITDKAK